MTFVNNNINSFSIYKANKIRSHLQEIGLWKAILEVNLK